MGDQSRDEDEVQANEEAEADRRFQDALQRMMNTPHQPHEKKGREPKPAPDENPNSPNKRH